MSAANKKNTEDTKKRVMEDITPNVVKNFGPNFLLIDWAISI